MGELDDVARHAEHVPLGVPALARRADGRAASVHRPAARLHLLRDYYDVPYPLAHHQPFVSGRQLVYEAQGGSGLAPEFCLVAAVSGQYVLTPASESYLTRGDVGRWYRDSLTSDDDPASQCESTRTCDSAARSFAGSAPRSCGRSPRAARTCASSPRRSTLAWATCRTPVWFSRDARWRCAASVNSTPAGFRARITPLVSSSWTVAGFWRVLGAGLRALPPSGVSRCVRRRSGFSTWTRTSSGWPRSSRSFALTSPIPATRAVWSGNGSGRPAPSRHPRPRIPSGSRRSPRSAGLSSPGTARSKAIAPRWGGPGASNRHPERDLI